MPLEAIWANTGNIRTVDAAAPEPVLQSQEEWQSG